MCQVAVELLKRTAERGEGGRGLALAKREYDAMDHHAALMQYLRLSSLGVELAQSNAAWMLKHGYGCAHKCAAAAGVGSPPSPGLRPVQGRACRAA